MTVPHPLASNDPEALGLGVGPTEPVRVALGRAAPQATFLFRFEPDRGRIYPAGARDTFFTPPVPGTGPFATGAITAEDDERCVARFAAVDDTSRPRAEAFLHRWAAADDWTLRIAPGLAPLPVLLDGYAHESVCTHCGVRRYVSVITMPYYGLQAFSLTRCDVCGIGRRLHVRD